MRVRKLRLERGWSQETLAELSGLSVRTVQRVERGASASLDTLTALSAVFEVELTELSKEAAMYQQESVSDEEQEAMEYVRDIKSFYAHLAWFVVASVGCAIWNLIATPDFLWVVWMVVGWGVGVAIHGLTVFEVFTPLGADWERRQIAKRLERKRG